MWRLILLVLLLIFAESGFAARGWLKVSTPSFELYTSASEGNAKRAIQQFERVRGFFSQETTHEEVEADPVVIVVFRSAREFRPFRRHEGVAAFYLRDRDRDYIVMGGFGERYERVAVHEYLHLLVERSQAKLPLWFNEGLAELYETLAPRGKNVLVGEPNPGNMATLEKYRWLPLETLVAVDHSSSYYNEADKARIFYAQSWLLTHMLALSREYRPGFSRSLSAFQHGISAEEAFREVYDKSLEEVEKDLKSYPRSNLRVAVFPVRLEKSAEQPLVEAVDVLEAELIQAKILTSIGKTEEADRRFAELLRQSPGDSRVEEALGYRYWRESELEQARAHFARAVELGSSNPLMYYEYALIERRSGVLNAEIIPLLQMAVELDPQYTDAQFQLAQSWLREREHEKALHHYSLVAADTPERALQLLHGMALACAGIGDLETAQQAAQKAQEYATTPEERSRLEDLLTYLGQLREREEMVREMARRDQSVRARVPETVVREGRPSLVRRTEQPLEEPLPTERLTIRIEGSLESVDCLGVRARLNVHADGRLSSFAIYDSNKVMLRGTGGEAVELRCGQQQMTPVVIEFEPHEDQELGTIGAVQVLEFK